LSALSAVTSLGVGLATVYLGTHWLSDVLLGWVAGLLILLALPWFEPLIARTESRVFELRDRWRARRGRTAPAARPAGAPVVLGPLTDREDAPAPEPVPTGRAATRAHVYLAPGPHTTRGERTPVTPAGSRRPPHAERHPRGTTSATRP
jgi:hypothetical protein